MERFDKPIFFGELNNPRLKGYVYYLPERCSIVGVAGAGKTLTVENILKKRKGKSYLYLCFNDKAAKSFANRIGGKYDQDSKVLVFKGNDGTDRVAEIRTLDSFALQLLKDYQKLIPGYEGYSHDLNKSFNEYYSTGKRKIIEDGFFDSSKRRPKTKDEKEFEEDKEVFLKALRCLGFKNSKGKPITEKELIDSVSKEFRDCRYNFSHNDEQVFELMLSHRFLTWPLIEDMASGILENQYSKLSFDYDYVIVDEAQDLNNVQQNLIYSLEKRLKQGYGPYDPNAPGPGTIERPDHDSAHHLIFLGDPKQCIYTYNGANNNAILNNSVIYQLLKNRRCDKAIIDFCNKIPNPRPNGAADYTTKTYKGKDAGYEGFVARCQDWKLEDVFKKLEADNKDYLTRATMSVMVLYLDKNDVDSLNGSFFNGSFNIKTSSIKDIDKMSIFQPKGLEADVVIVYGLGGKWRDDNYTALRVFVWA